MSTNELNENTEQPDFFRDIPVPYAVFQLIYDEGRKKVVNTRYTYVNEAYCEMEGHGWEELIGRHFLDIYPGGSICFPYCQQALEENRTVQTCLYSKEVNHWLDFTVGPAAGKDCVAFVFMNFDESIKKIRRETNTDNIILNISKLLNNDEDFEKSMNHALEELSRYIYPDRLYVLETDGITCSNTFEWCAPGVQPEIDTLQNLRYDEYLGAWEKYLKKSSDVVISDIEELKADDLVDYENLKRQGIRCLAAAPFYNRGKLIGYLGADNYKKDDLVNTQLVLNSISYFIGTKIVNHRLMEDLNRLSSMDTLTNVHNRNAMMAKMKELSEKHVPTGLVYADVNSLKIVNDTQGHESGDEALKYSADMLASHFGRENVYRAGGDEFVVLFPMVDEKTFLAKKDALTKDLEDGNPYHFSFGVFWCPDSSTVEGSLRIADQQMYQEKEKYYRRKGVDRRRRNTWV